jgi:hypothetical protein
VPDLKSRSSDCRTFGFDLESHSKQFGMVAEMADGLDLAIVDSIGLTRSDAPVLQR